MFASRARSIANGNDASSVSPWSAGPRSENAFTSPGAYQADVICQAAASPACAARAPRRTRNSVMLPETGSAVKFLNAV